MAVNKYLLSTALVLEVQTGEDPSGNPLYRKKNFSGIKEGATNQSILDVANLIKGVLGTHTRSFSLSETHKLISE